MIVNTFTGKTQYNYAAFDFETHTYVDGRLLPDDEIWEMCGKVDKETGAPVYPSKWWREHCEVKCWAWIIYTPDGFAIAETFDEWLDVIQSARIICGWFYNAPFDFSILDYTMLSRGWKYEKDMGQVKSPQSFGELCNDYGARYIMTISAPYVRKKGDRSKRDAWRFRMHDLRNILHGGLDQLLEDFKVTDGDGTPIRKLEMDYQSATGAGEDEIAYMRNDAAGLWWLIQKAGGIMAEQYGLDIRGKTPDVLTASGLSKRVLLRSMYPESRTKWHAAWQFRREHPMSLVQDADCREHGLLAGGLVIVNDRFRGQHLTGIRLNRYDVNSEYPFYMWQMRSVFGYPYTYKTLAEAQEWHRPDDCYILVFRRLSAYLRPGAVACWRDPFTRSICAEYDHRETFPALYMFLEEFVELCEWYDIIHADIAGVIVYRTRVEPAIRALIEREYGGKQSARDAGDKGLEIFHKLTQNGLGGKYSQNPIHSVSERIINSGPASYVSLVERGEEKDENSLMHVVQGARITAGGRIILRRYARMICGGAEHTAEKWAYGDTDSIHALATAPAEIVDARRLGALKCENKTPITRACFLAPKTYYEIEESGKMEIHAKGVNTSAIERLLRLDVPIEKIYTEGYRIQSLSALNVRGGKALLPLQKQLLRPLDDDETYT